MRELAALVFQSLDGVMQAPGAPDEDTSGGFSSGGWATDYWGPVMEQVLAEAMSEPYDVLFGRRTYEGFAAHWPAQGDSNPVAQILNNARKYVVTSTLDELEWSHARVVAGDPAESVSALKRADGPLLQAHGSWQLLQRLLDAGLIDELRLWTFPVALGEGKRLFAEGTTPRRFELVKSATCSNGVAMGIYRLSG